MTLGLRRDHPHRRQQLGGPHPRAVGLLAASPVPVVSSASTSRSQHRASTSWASGSCRARRAVRHLADRALRASGGPWTAIREDEVAAEAMGIHTSRYKLLSYAIGAFLRRPDRRLLRPLPQLHRVPAASSSSSPSIILLPGRARRHGQHRRAGARRAVIWIGCRSACGTSPFVQARIRRRAASPWASSWCSSWSFRPQGLLGSRRVALEMKPRARQRQSTSGSRRRCARRLSAMRAEPGAARHGRP